ncbi:AraC family transcriptional regulator [Leptospira gomenensis]|uniref:AraC family transcriptional regulator n=1 Tax=Leptospira gomenensis TaxID=2484974 RepID=A0A5F1Z1C8_9LEPT|nr:helix-turn-helix domain-containing protein [Leptospira gomenensis]TGK36398.1 AraC family transcriptional regulator [Leptospira gomenensis]TGK41932.1 AraC family transcriptional regulator [Leptospira gomenensis]TGK49526.1 AraC family transcriptional regulator [Leptospira gomenensis]TGK67576.1 AraC family transcriptional regulator [Leptospira gomenensis]
MITEITNILNFFSVGGLVSLLLFFFLRYRYDIRGKIAVCFILSTLAYLILNLDVYVQIHPTLRNLLFLCLLALPFFYWLISLAAFDDHFEIKKWYWFLLLGKLALSALVTYPELGQISLRGPVESEKALSRILIPSIFSLGFILVAVFQTYMGRKDDLIESRRTLRQIHILISGIVISLNIFTHLFLRGKEVSEFLDLLNGILTWGLILAFQYLMFDLKDGLIAEKAGATEEEKPPPVDPQLQKKLIDAFEKGKLYRSEGLTIRILAEELQVHEYKLRRLINGNLGFRNFNDFLNRYRIQEACEILLDPSKDEIPVIRIAMDLGYQSLGPFNRAFKELTSVTPTEYRKNRTDRKINPNDFEMNKIK